MWKLSVASTLILVSLCLASPDKPSQTKVRNRTNNDLVDSTGTSKVLDNNDNENNNNSIDQDGSSLIVDKLNTQTSDDCACVPYYQCKNHTVITGGAGLIDMRFSDSCDNDMHVCCKTPNVLNPGEEITPAPFIHEGCGWRHSHGTGSKLTGGFGNETQFGEFPWMVAILKTKFIDQKEFNVYQCGGALVHPKAVLTSAHCVDRESVELLTIRAGEWDTNTETEMLPHQDRGVSNITVHKGFDPHSLHNDFAIIILSSPVELAENVDVVCLPEQDTQFDGTRCIASGWGKNAFGEKGRYQGIPKRIELPIIPHDFCENILQTTRLGYKFKLNRSFICAGGEGGSDTCTGDGGSPLVCPLRDDLSRYVQAGIVAWGIGCGAKEVPGVYGNVASARKWIDDQIADNNLDTTFYQYST